MCNIYTGEIAAANVNVQSALRIGEEMMTTFENSLPEVFFKKMSKEVITV